MEWQAPAIVLDARPLGEADAVATLLTEEHGAWRGLVRGGQSRAQIATWQAGNLVEARWVARLADQLGSLTGELVHATAARAMASRQALEVMASACAVAEGALPDRAPHPLVFDGLLHLLAHLPDDPAMLDDLVRWEIALLAELGFALDLSACALTGATTGLAYVSPRTGRAVCAEAAGIWRDRLLVLPPFLVGGPPGAAADWLNGLKLTGHFLARDAFGQQNRPLPAARRMLVDRLCAPGWPAAARET